jgi:ribosomal protein L18
MARWLTAVREITGKFEFGLIGTLLDANETPSGTIYTGSISRVIEASALLCLQLSTEETTTSSDTAPDSIASGAKIELIMGNKYEAVQAGAMGPGAHAHDMNFNQVWNQLSNSIDLLSLSSELSELRAKLKEKATDTEHDIAVGSLALAEQAAKKGDGPKTLEYLAKAGKWALDAATQIGTTVAAEAIKKSIGM